MNLVLLERAELADGRVVVRDRRARHLREVLRVACGDSVRVGVLGGRRGAAVVTGVEPGAVALSVTLDAPASPRPRVDLVLAMPRPKALARALQTAAAMGAGRIDIVNAWRVDKSYFGSPALAPDALRAALVLGCEQGATTWLPELAVHRLLMPFLTKALAQRVCTATGHSDERAPIAVIAHPRAEARLEDAAPPGDRRGVIAAIGPERGWIDRELASFAELGFAPVRLGEPVLRVDTAVTALLAQLALLGRLPPG